jgi:hypothetical protein
MAGTGCRSGLYKIYSIADQIDQLWAGKPKTTVGLLTSSLISQPTPEEQAALHQLEDQLARAWTRAIVVKLTVRGAICRVDPHSPGHRLNHPWNPPHPQSPYQPNVCHFPPTISQAN